MKTLSLAVGLMILLTSTSFAQQSKGGSSTQLKKSVAAIELNDGRVIKGRIVAVRQGGIIFDADRSGPFYDPKPKFYPVSDIRRFLDRNGRTVWQNPQAPKHKAPPKKIRYQAKIGLHGGVGQYLSAYSQPSSAESMRNVVQDIQTGGQFGIEAAMILHRHFGFGIHFTRHSSTIRYYGVASAPASVGVSDLGTVSTFAFRFSYLRPVTRRAMFHADFGLGQSTFTGDGKFMPLPEPVRLSGFSTSIGTGFDFFITRRFAVGFEVSAMLGRVADYVGGEPIDFKQNLNRVDINAGVRYYF